jgi:hypothetical protein
METNQLRKVKILHTVVWAALAACVFAIPVAAWAENFRLALILIVVMIVEVVVLALNGWTCPLTGVAGRYTDDRRDNFDIYLPLWLAKHNKTIFGSLFVAGIVFTFARWSRLI